MPILDLRFSNKALQQLPHPNSGCQEYRDTQCRALRALVYPQRITLALRVTIQNRRIYKTLGSFPLLSVDSARQHVLSLLANTNELVMQSHRHTVAEAIDKLWLPDLQLYKKNTQPELSKLNCHIRPYWSKRVLSEITPNDIEKFAASLLNTLKPATINRVLAILSKIFSLAIKAGWIKHSPSTHVRYLKERNIRYRTLSTQEIPAFIEAATAINTPAADALLLALFTGMRISEVCQLEWRYWHADQRQLILPDTKSNHPFTCTLSMQAVDIILKQQAMALSSRYLFPRLSDPLKPLSYPRNTFAQICRNASIEDLCIHDLRRTFATRALQVSGDIALTSKLLNHHSLVATQRYAFHSQDSARQIIDYIIDK